MMTIDNTPATIAVALGLTAHTTANQFRQAHPPRKGRQVYLNTLAIYAVKTYLEQMGFDCDLSSGSSWDRHQQTLMDSADLVMVPGGRLECRPVLPDATIMTVPPETWSDRTAYIAVQLDDSLREATILGFVPTVTAAQVPLTDLQPLDNLLDQLSQPQPIEPVTPPVNLGAWLHNVADASWRTLGELFDPLLSPAQPALSFRSDRPPSSDPASSATLVQRGKVLSLPMATDSISLLLRLGLWLRSAQEVEIWVQLETTDQSPLPHALILLILDQVGAEVMYAQARNTEAMQLQFIAAAGEHFGVQIRLHDQTITETFVVELGDRLV